MKTETKISFGFVGTVQSFILKEINETGEHLLLITTGFSAANAFNIKLSDSDIPLTLDSDFTAFINKAAVECEIEFFIQNSTSNDIIIKHPSVRIFSNDELIANSTASDTKYLIKANEAIRINNMKFEIPCKESAMLLDFFFTEPDETSSNYEIDFDPHVFAAMAGKQDYKLITSN